MGILLQPTWWEDATDASPPYQWQGQSQAVTVQFSTTEAAIFTGASLALAANTPVTLTAATMPGGFVAGTVYYVIPLLGTGPLTFALSTTPNGLPLKATSAGATVIAHDQRYYFKNNTVLLLHMDGVNGGTAFPDSSPFAHIATRTGTPTTDTSDFKFPTASMKSIGAGNGSLSFPLSGALEFAPLGNDFTIETFFKIDPTGIGVGGTITRCRFGANDELGTLTVSAANKLNVAFSGFLQDGITPSSGGISGTTTLVANVWYHVAYVRFGNIFTIYLNGVSEGSITVPIYTIGSTVSANHFTVNGDEFGGSGVLLGRQDEFRYVNGKAFYTANFTPPSAPFSDGLPTYDQITYIGQTVAGKQNGLFGTARLSWQIVNPALSGIPAITYNVGAGPVTIPLSNTSGATGVVSVALDGATQFTFGLANPPNLAVIAIGEALGDTTYGNVNFNCSNPELDTFDTLINLRNRMMLRLGFGAQVANPPPGMTTLLTEFLQSAQTSLYKRYPARFTRRFFTWQMQAGDRFYGIKANTDDTYRNLRADFTKGIEWSGIYDTKNTWTPIFEGIMPELYTMVTQLGRPIRYEIRECIEVFPAPDGPYTLVLKAHIGLSPLVADSDQTTIDSEVVFLHALAVAKLHYGKPDAVQTQAMANTYLGELCASTHLNKRYIPGTHPQMPIVKPVLISFQDGS